MWTLNAVVCLRSVGEVVWVRGADDVGIKNSKVGRWLVCVKKKGEQWGCECGYVAVGCECWCWMQWLACWVRWFEWLIRVLGVVMWVGGVGGLGGLGGVGG